VTFDQLSGSESGSVFKKLDPDSDTDSDPEEYSFCIAFAQESQARIQREAKTSGH